MVRRWFFSASWPTPKYWSSQSTWAPPCAPNCNDPLQTFLERLYNCTQSAVREQYGELSILRLNLDDLAHMNKIGSVFLRCFQGEPAEVLA